MVYANNEIVPLLLEARLAYVYGLFFSTIAASATTADRICCGLLDRYEVATARRRNVLAQTFGQKLQQLRAMSLISGMQEGVLGKLNKIRNRHLHPKGAISTLTTQRDALRCIMLLHRFLDETESVFRDYVIEDGKLMPRPIS